MGANPRQKTGISVEKGRVADPLYIVSNRVPLAVGYHPVLKRLYMVLQNILVVSMADYWSWLTIVGLSWICLLDLPERWIHCRWIY